VASIVPRAFGRSVSINLARSRSYPDNMTALGLTPGEA
jgi:hypothetical protein